MPVRLATASDIPAIMHIVRGTIALMHDAGNDQWDDSYPAPADFLRDIERHTLHVEHIPGERPRGFICIDTSEPEEYAPLPWTAQGTSYVIHRTAVAPEFRRLGIGRILFDFAEQLAAERNAASVKTDTHTSNKHMSTMLLQRGYKTIGTMSFKGKDRPFLCYEKSLPPRDAAMHTPCLPSDPFLL